MMEHQNKSVDEDFSDKKNCTLIEYVFVGEKTLKNYVFLLSYELLIGIYYYYYYYHLMKKKKRVPSEA